MSIENQLKLAFKQSAVHLKPPHQLDARIEHCSTGIHKPMGNRKNGFLSSINMHES
jgi:hypothetical protein